MRPIFLFFPSSRRQAKLLARGKRAETKAIKIGVFPDGEPRVILPNRSSGQRFVLVSPQGGAPESPWLTLSAIRAARENGWEGQVIFPILPFGRGDKALPGEGRLGLLLAECVSLAGAQKVILIAPHSREIAAKFSCPKTVIEPLPDLARKVAAFWRPDTILAPDLGAVFRGRQVAKELNVNLAVAEKIRISPQKTKVAKIRGRIGRRVLIVDDLVATGSTLFEAAAAVRRQGAKEVRALAVHGTLAENFPKRFRATPLQKLYLTDSCSYPRLPGLVTIGLLEKIGRQI